MEATATLLTAQESEFNFPSFLFFCSNTVRIVSFYVSACIISNQRRILYSFDLCRHLNSQNVSPDQAPSTGATITIYANGFKIGDGEFQDQKIPENAKVLDDLKQGCVFDLWLSI